MKPVQVQDALSRLAEHAVATGSCRSIVRELQKLIALQALERNGGKLYLAAEYVGVDQKTLRRHMGEIVP